MKKSLILFCLIIFPSILKADFIVDYFKINYQPLLGLISIESNYLRSEETYNNAVLHRKELLDNNIFIEDNKEIKEYIREYTLGNNKIKISTKVDPPDRDYSYFVHLKVTINGFEKISIPLGSVAKFYDMDVHKITLHSDGVIDYDIRVYQSGYEFEDNKLLEYEFFNDNSNLKKKLDTDVLFELIKEKEE